jgi:arylsulfatase
VLPACGGGEIRSTPVDLLEHVRPDIVAPVELRDETRKTLTTDLGSRIEFDVSLPEEPILTFSIGASSRDRPTLLVPVVFRVLVDETEVFREEIRRAQGKRWHSRVVALGRRPGRRARVALEAVRSDGGIEGGEGHVAAHWGNPVIRSRKPESETPALFLITIDCLRADHVGAYGYFRGTTPNLDALAREATLFRNATAVSSYTLPTHASMLTGLPPSLHGAATRSRISSALETLPERLASEGYWVQGLVSGPFLAPIYGFADGFDTYRLSSSRASDLVGDAIALLNEGAGFRRFLFLHFFDVHAPYSPPGEFIELFGKRPEDISRLHTLIQKRGAPETELEIEQAKNLYDGEIAYVDREIGRFFAELEKRGLYDSSLIVVTADHGEAFYEHGSWEHGRPWQDEGPQLFQEIVHIPLLVKAPHARRGAVVEHVVSQTDLFATFLDAAGVSFDGPWSKSLLRPRGRNGWALSEFVALPRAREAILEIALRRDNLKYRTLYRAGTLDGLYTAAPAEEWLYDLDSDPLESQNLIATGAGGADRPRDAVRRYLEVARERRARSLEENLRLESYTQRKLESLGYVER